MSSPQNDARRPAAFLDRDGTIIVEREYLGDPDGVEIMPGVAEAIRLLNDWGYWVIAVSNQSGVARGFYGSAEVDRVNQRIIKVLGAAGARLDRIYYCPHLPEINQARGEEPCNCRKPSPGMIERAQADFPIDMSRSFVVGDQLCDIGLARAAGLPSILVLTGFGESERLRLPDDASPDFIAKNLLDAILWFGRNFGLLGTRRT